MLRNVTWAVRVDAQQATPLHDAQLELERVGEARPGHRSAASCHPDRRVQLWAAPALATIAPSSRRWPARHLRSPIAVA
jgi:hypothetical protein